MSASPVGESADSSKWVDIVRRIAMGDRAAESAFVSHFLPGVRALVRRQCRPCDPAVDDLIQDVLANVLQQLRQDGLEDRQALPAYLRATVTFTVQAHYRKRARRREDEADAGVDEPVEPVDPARAMERAAQETAVRQLVEELSVPRDRELLRRFYLQDQDRDDVCHALGIDPSHFHRVLYRARERLRDLLMRADLSGEDV